MCSSSRSRLQSAGFPPAPAHNTEGPVDPAGMQTSTTAALTVHRDGLRLKKVESCCLNQPDELILLLLRAV